MIKPTHPPCSNNDLQTVSLLSEASIKHSALIESEKALAMRNLLHENKFRLNPQTYKNPPAALTHLSLGINANKLILLLEGNHKTHKQEISVSLKPLNRMIKDYFIICDSYQKTHHLGDHTKIETIDMARRGLHDDAADKLIDILSRNIDTDHATARNLFTLICILHIGKRHFIL
jgi:uncharacterized protein (UPF0262 family)